MARKSEERCSFCRKAESEVGKLIASPSGDPDPLCYICDECVIVCASILEYERSESSAKAVGHPVVTDPDSLLWHPMAPQLLETAARWTRQELSGEDGAEELAEVRRLARAMIAGKSEPIP